MDIAWSSQFQFDDQLLSGTNDGKLDDLGFGSPSSPSSPSSDELVDLPLALPILDTSDLLNPSTLTPSDSFLLPSIFNTETMVDVPPSFQIPPSGPSSFGKRHLEQNSLEPAKRPNKGKKLKVDGNTKRERNKVSAAKYRQRRKVYIDGLEDHVRQLNEKLEAQSKVITALKTENQMLKEQTNYLKKLVESLSVAKTSMQSMSPFNLVKAENSLGKAVKPMGAGLFLLAICCLVFSFSFQLDNGPMSSLPVRSSSRTLLHHDDTLVHHDEECNNDSSPIVSLSVGSPPGYSDTETIVNVDLDLNPELQVFAQRHSLGTGAAA